MGLEPVGEVALNAVEEYDPMRKDQFHEVDGEPMDSGVFENAKDDNITVWREANVHQLEAYNDVTGAALDPRGGDEGETGGDQVLQRQAGVYKDLAE